MGKGPLWFPLKGDWATERYTFDLVNSRSDKEETMGRFASTCTIMLALLAGGATSAAAPTTRSTAAAVVEAVPFGANKAAGETFVHDGVTLYYEIYGEGEPLLLIHGNGGGIGTLAAQIDFFRTHRRVIVMDSRDQGRSSDSAGPLTYEKMTDDQAALLEHLKIGPVDVLGWSDGGIEALLMGIRHPDKVKKLIAMAANLSPDAAYPETDQLVTEMLASFTPEVRKTSSGQRDLKVATILVNEPHIDLTLLKKVTAPTLILSSDHDLIRLDHTVALYEALPNAQLAVFPDSTHLVPYDDPQLFNATVERFLSTPFKKKDRIADTMTSFGKLMSELPK